MPLETGDKIEDLNELWPLGTDGKNFGDDHLRLIKDILKQDAISAAKTDAQEVGGDFTVKGEFRAEANVYVDRIGQGTTAFLNIAADAGNNKVVRFTTSADGSDYVAQIVYAPTGGDNGQLQLQSRSNDTGQPSNTFVFDPPGQTLTDTSVLRKIDADALYTKQEPVSNGYLVGAKLTQYGSGTTGAGGRLDITFGRPYDGLPKVSVSTDGLISLVRYANLSPTGFSIFTTNTAGAGVVANVNWQAMGNDGG